MTNLETDLAKIHAAPTETPEQIRDRAIEERFQRQMKACLPEGWSFGYIGNVYFGPMKDDRCWYIFVPHPGRVGTSEDRIGGFATADRFKLAQIAAGIAFGLKMAREGRAK